MREREERDKDRERANKKVTGGDHLSMNIRHLMSSMI